MKIDLLNVDFLQNPHPQYDKLREEYPLFYSQKHHVWFVLSYDIAKIVLTTEKRFLPINAAQQNGLHTLSNRFIRQMFLLNSVEQHSTFRRVVTAYFTNVKLAELRGDMQLHAEKLLQKLKVGQVQIIEQFIEPFVAGCMLKLFGLPETEHNFINKNANLMAAFYNFPPEKKDENSFLFGMSSLDKYFNAVIRDNSFSNDGLIYYLMQQHSAGLISLREVVMICILMVNGAQHFSVCTISTSLHDLLTNPKQRDLFVENDATKDQSIEELLRYNGGSSYTSRRASADIVVGDQTIATNDLVYVLLNAVNRDPKVFENPHELNLNRNGKRNMSLGGGPYSCLGYHLAKMEIEVALNTFFKLFPDAHVVEKPLRLNRFGYTGLQSLYLQLY
jgi:pimeloyl-[acyl-carrier protein] synthase